MILLFKLAIRNAKRNINSSLLNGIGISFSVILLLFIFSLSRGIESQIISRNIKFETGAISISLDEKTSSFGNKIFGDSLIEKISSVLNKNPSINNYSYRIYPPKSLLYLRDNTQSINLIGISEKDTLLLLEMLKILDGSANFSSENKGILVSNGIAEQYNLKKGDVCNIMLQTVDGVVNLSDYIISGIFRYTSQMNKYSVYMNYEQAKLLYNTNLPSRVLINLNNIEKTDEVKTFLLKKLNCDSNSLKINEQGCKGFEIKTYKDYLGIAKSLSSFNRYGMLSIAFFIIMISFVGIWSMQIENINDRLKEIGTMLSMGFSKNAVKLIFIFESMIISVMYFLIGFGLIFIFILITNSYDGIYIGESASFAFGSSIINPSLTFKDIIITLISVFFYPLIAVIFSLKTLNNKNIINLLNGN